MTAPASTQVKAPKVSVEEYFELERTFETFDGVGEFEIPCLGVSLSLDSIYANLEL